MMHSWLAIAFGLALLAVGGELLVRGAARLALRFGISSLVIGLTVVAFGTSAPELAVALRSVGAEADNLALGNVVGSNIFNVLFILGVSALLLPLVVSKRVVWIEVPIMIGLSMLILLLALDGRLGRLDGLLLLALVLAYTVWLIRSSRAEQDAEGTPRPPHPGRASLAALAVAAAGIGLLAVGARALVEGAVDLAVALGVSQLVIGLTIVAVGTSLPEVAASIVATLRGHRDMAIGNIVGSNIFNLTLILGATALAAGELRVAPGVLKFDLVVMTAVAVACLPIFFTGHRIARWEGALFLTYYAAYTAYLVLDATDHELLPRFEDALLFFALPLTAITLVVLMGHAAWRNNAART